MQENVWSQKKCSEALRTCPLFSGLPARDMHALARVMSERSYETGEMLFLQGDRAEGFFVILHGQVKVCRLGQEGREQVLHLMGSGDLCGEVPVFQGGRYPATAVATTRTDALYVPGDKFLETGEANPEIFLEMLAVLSMRLRHFVHLIDDLSLKEVSARVAKHILDLHIREKSARVTLDTTKGVLAARLGTIAETFSRTLKKMQGRGIIRVQGRLIEILNRDALVAIAAGGKL